MLGLEGAHHDITTPVSHRAVSASCQKRTLLERALEYFVLSVTAGLQPVFSARTRILSSPNPERRKLWPAGGNDERSSIIV
jgi:hypothetical protein